MFLSPRRALLRWPFLLALAVLLLNDHLLKGAGLLPGWLTGKLSDVAGLYVAPVVLAALIGIETRTGAWLVALVIGLGFTGLQLSAATKHPVADPWPKD